MLLNGRLEEFFDGAGEFLLLHLDPGATLAAIALDEFSEVVEVLARHLASAAFDIDTAHLAARVDGAAKNLERRRLGNVADIHDFQAETQVGLVAAIFEHGIRITQTRQRQRDGHAGAFLENIREQILNDAEDVVDLDERHFHVELGELRLPVGAQVFVAQAAGDLEILIEAGDHQDLLVKLRRLRQRVPAFRRHPAGHQIVACAFGRAATQERRFHLQKTLLIEVIADHLIEPMPQHQHALNRHPAQIEIAILQPQILVGQLLSGKLRYLERRGGAAVENGEFLGLDFNVAGRQLGIVLAGQPFAHHALHRQNELTPDFLGQREHFVVCLENRLGYAVAITHINENLIVIRPIGIDPAVQNDGFPDMCFPQFSARMCSLPARHFFPLLVSRNRCKGL